MSGRVAFACKSVYPIYDLVTASGDKVQVAPLTLPTPGKADVVVTILQGMERVCKLCSCDTTNCIFMLLVSPFPLSTYFIALLTRPRRL